MDECAWPTAFIRGKGCRFGCSVRPAPADRIAGHHAGSGDARGIRSGTVSLGDRHRRRAKPQYGPGWFGRGGRWHSGRPAVVSWLVAHPCPTLLFVYELADPAAGLRIGGPSGRLPQPDRRAAISGEWGVEYLSLIHIS